MVDVVGELMQPDTTHHKEVAPVEAVEEAMVAAADGEEAEEIGIVEAGVEVEVAVVADMVEGEEVATATVAVVVVDVAVVEAGTEDDIKTLTNKSKESENYLLYSYSVLTSNLIISSFFLPKSIKISVSCFIMRKQLIYLFNSFLKKIKYIFY